MAESKFPMDFEKCPICGCKDTTCRLAYKEEVVDKERGPEVFSSSSKVAVPLLDPRSAMVTVPTLIEHYDNCAGCGFHYCTKSEIVNAPISIQPPPGQGKVIGGPFGKR